jgi:hypothetical protein
VSQHARVHALIALRDNLAAMRRGALVVAWLAAGCSDAQGVDIEIYAPGDVELDRVELFLAYEQCTTADCPNGVAWTEKERATGDIYFLRDERVIAARELGDRWVLHLEAAPRHQDPFWVGVVGYSGTTVKAVKVLRSVHIPTNSVEIWKVYLHDADPATTALAIAPSDGDQPYRAHVWAREPTPELAEPTGCLVYQKWDDTDGTWETEYFVPKSDPDCDGHTVECSGYWFDYKPLGRCVGDTGLQIADVCAVGTSPCADGVTSSRSCGEDTSRTFTCVPDAFCEHCGDSIPADTCIAKAVEAGITAGTLPRYACSLDTTIDGLPCSEHHVTLQLPFVNAMCGTPTMHYLDRPFTEGQSTLLFGTAPDEIKLSAKANPAGPCLLDIHWLGGPSSGFGAGLTFLLDVPYDNATRAIYPITINTTNTTVTCGLNPVATMCLVKGSPLDRVGRCAAK